MAKKKSKIAKLKAKARGDNAIAHVNLDELNQFDRRKELVEEDKYDIFGNENKLLNDLYIQQQYEEEFPKLGLESLHLENKICFEQERRLSDDDCMTEGIPESLEEFKTETSGERADDDISDIPSESEYDIRSFFSNECMVMPNGKLELEYLKNNKLSVLKIAGVNADILKTFKNENVYELYFRQFDFCENLLGFDIKEFPKMTINGKYFYCLYFKGVFDKQDAIKELSGKYIRGNMMYRFCSTRESKSLNKYTYQASMILCLVELNDRNELKYYV